MVDDGAILTLDFGSLLTAPGTLSIFTIDDLFPAAASIAISADASTFTLLSAFVTDANGQVAPPFFPSVNLAVGVPFRYVKIMSVPDPQGELAGFDVDAVGYVASDVVTTPEPSSLALLSVGGIVCAVRRIRRSVGRDTLRNGGL